MSKKSNARKKEIKKKKRVEAQSKAPREHTQSGDYRPKTTEGSKFSKKANMTVKYRNFNKSGQADIQEFI